MIYHIWLSRLNISRRKAFALACLPGGAKTAFETPPRELASYVRLSKRDIEELSDKSLKTAEKIIKDCRLSGIDIITANDERYPERLKQIYDPPTVLYARGTLPEIDSLFVFAVVGSRDPMKLSVSFAEKVAGELAEEGYLIVSGLAKGIDGTAHKAALMHGFPTVAVYGTAIDRDYPFENRSLAEKVVKNGAIISENPPGFETFPSDFRIRNRIISGLSMGVLVIQAGERSGSLNTANFALDQGRDVFVMPGPPGVDAFLGSNKLIKDGACLTSDASDIILACKECAKSFEKVARTGQNNAQNKEKARALTPDEQSIFGIIDGKKNADRIIEESGMPAQKVTALLTYMELSGIISQLPGQIFIKK